MAAAAALDSVRLTFHTSLTPDAACVWEGVLWQRRLYLQLPSGFQPSGSRECFIAMLEYGEEVLKASHVVVCMRKDRTDRASLMRTFMFLGFAVLPPTSPWIPDQADASNVYMFSSNE